MHLRKGMTYRLYDHGPLTLACGTHFMGDGPHRWPTLTLILRDRWTKSNGRGGRATIYRRLELPLPFIRFNTAWRLRRFGVLRLYGLLAGTYRRAFAAPR